MSPFNLLQLDSDEPLSKHSLEPQLESLVPNEDNTLLLLRDLYSYYTQYCVCGKDDKFCISFVRAEGIKKLVSLIISDKNPEVVNLSVLLLGAIKDNLRITNEESSPSGLELSEDLIQLAVHGDNKTRKHARDSLSLLVTNNKDSHRFIKYNELLYYAPDLLAQRTLLPSRDAQQNKALTQTQKVNVPEEGASSSSSSSSTSDNQKARPRNRKNASPTSGIPLSEKEGILETAILLLRNNIVIPRLPDLLNSAKTLRHEAAKQTKTRKAAVWEKILYLVSDLFVAARFSDPPKEEEEIAEDSEGSKEDVTDDDDEESTDTSSDDEAENLSKKELVRRYKMLSDLFITGKKPQIDLLSLELEKWKSSQVFNNQNFYYLTMACSPTHWVVGGIRFDTSNSYYYVETYYATTPEGPWTKGYSLSTASYRPTVGKMIYAQGQFLLPWTYNYSSQSYGFYVAYASSPSSWSNTCTYNPGRACRVYSMEYLQNYYVICGDYDSANNNTWYSNGVAAYCNSLTGSYSASTSLPPSSSSTYYGSCIQMIHDGTQFVALCKQYHSQSIPQYHYYLSSGNSPSVGSSTYPVLSSNANLPTNPTFVYAKGYYVIAVDDRIVYSKGLNKPFFSIPLSPEFTPGSMRSLSFINDRFVFAHNGSDSGFHIAFASEPDGKWISKKLHDSALTASDAVEQKESHSIAVAGYQQGSKQPQVFYLASTADGKAILKRYFQTK